MTKLNGNDLLAKAEQLGRVHRMKRGWRTTMNVCAVLMCLLILPLPFGIWFFFVARNARLGMTDEGFAIKWFGTKAWAWQDIEGFRQQALNIHASGGGLVGALAGAAASAAIAKRSEGLNGPLTFKLKGKRFWATIPAHAIERSFEMAEEMERRTGLEILPRPAAQAVAQAA